MTQEQFTDLVATAACGPRPDHAGTRPYLPGAHKGAC